VDHYLGPGPARQEASQANVVTMAMGDDYPVNIGGIDIIFMQER
jgi:hypothetical protein